MKTKVILVTGGAGFIGSNFIRYMFSHYRNVVLVNYDKLTYAGNLSNLIDIQKKYSDRYFFIKGDIADSVALQKVFEKYKVKWVVNFAAESHVDRSILNASPFLRTNVLGTHVLLDESLRYGIEKFLQISTDEVYGSIPEGEFATEHYPLFPSSPYAASKAASDMLVTAYWKTFKLPVIITRSSNNYGPFQFPEKFIPLIISNAIEDKRIPIYGDGKNIRDWIYVSDNCKAIANVLWKGEPGTIYNIGGENIQRNIDVAKLILQIMKKNDHLLTFVEDRKGHDLRYALQSTRIFKELGWRPLTNFKDGLKKTIVWYKNNVQWINSVKSKEYLDYYRKQYHL